MSNNWVKLGTHDGRFCWYYYFLYSKLLEEGSIINFNIIGAWLVHASQASTPVERHARSKEACIWFKDTWSNNINWSTTRSFYNWNFICVFSNQKLENKQSANPQKDPMRRLVHPTSVGALAKINACLLTYMFFGRKRAASLILLARSNYVF